MTGTAAFWRLLVALISIGLMPAAAWGLTLSISSPPTVTGTMFSVKTQTPGVLSISTQIHCTIVSGESCPSSVNLQYSLKRSGAVVISASDSPEGLRLQWIGNLTSKSATVTYLLQLPDFGAATTQMKTGQYTVNLRLQTRLTAPPTYVNSESSPFNYTVFSGNLWFRNNLTQLTSLTSEFDEYVCSSDFLLTAYSGSWNNGFASPSFTQAGNSALCVTNLGTPDGYSTDLDVDSGQVALPSVIGNTGGIYWILGYPTSGVTLSSAGVTFANAVAVLPASVTSHNLVNGQIWPAGFSGMPFSGGSFFGPLDNVTLSLSGSSYLHGENLPFYVAAQGASFNLGGGAGAQIVLTSPVPVYVHQAAETGLAATDPRKAYGFPSNDSLYRQAGANAGNVLTISQNGMSGTLAFSSSVGNTAFPFAYLAPSSFTLDLFDNSISTTSTMAGTVGFGMQFNPNCTEADCGNAMDNVGTSVASTGAAIFPNGAVAGQFAAAGEVAWGGYDGTNETFKRNDTGRTGIWLVPGFIMPGTAATETVESDLRVSQVMLGSFTFLGTGVMEPDAIHSLHDLNDWSAANGDGFFAGINLGPELLIGPYSGTPTITEGQGELLGNDINLRFNGNTSFNAMNDRPFTKYFYRPGGLTGVFNTSFSSQTGGAIQIYGYDMNFSRFAFRQDRNELSNKTFIDGSLIIRNGPVGGGAGKPGLRVGFTDLDLSCNGNLGNGSVDTEPEPGWPDATQAATNNYCDGQNWQGDTDTTIDEGCQILDYWNMPILLAGMSFVPDSADTAVEPDCNTVPRNLQLMTRNVIDGIGTPLTMIAQYPADGTLKDQELSGTVDTWFDRPTDGSLSGFSLRLQNAYLNQVTDPANPPSYGGAGGFTVLAGLTDVPLFNDVSLAGHFSNRDPAQVDDYSVSIFADETELDTDFDGVPDGSYGTVIDYRNLSQSAAGLPKPNFSYSWPSAGFIDLSYYAGYNSATANAMPQFLGVKKSSDIAGIFSIDSVPDFINPQRTKFSFGASAQFTELTNMQIDVGAMDLEQLGNFLVTELGVDANDVEAIKTSLSGLLSAEQLMHDMTGGDFTPYLRQAIEDELGNLAGQEINDMVTQLNSAQQAPNILAAQLTGPLTNLRSELLAKILPPEIDLADLYTRLAPFTNFPDTEQLRTAFLNGGGTDVEFDDMLADYEKIQAALKDLQKLLEQLQREKSNIKNFLDGTSTQSINSLHGYIANARTATTALWTALDNGIGSFIGADPGTNVLLGKLEEAKGVVRDARDAIKSVHLGEIADYLFLASLLAGSPLDTSFIRGAEETMTTMLDQLDGVIASADANMQALYNDIDFVAVYQQVESILGPAPTGLVQNSLNNIDVELNKLSFFIPEILDQMDGSADILLKNAIEPLANIIPGPDPVGTWTDAMTKGQTHLNAIRTDFIYKVFDLGASVPEPDAILEPVLNSIGSSDFVVLFSRDNLEMLLTAPLSGLLESAGLKLSVSLVEGHVAGLLPHPTSADIRRMISAAIVNSDAVQSINALFYAQIGRISDVVDDISTQLALQLNSLIKETLASVNEGLNSMLSSVSETVGFDGVESAGINGFALVSQDEIERIHLEAEFSFSNDPDPTSYNAALDVATWNSSNGENGKGACLTEASGGNIDVVISTHDVPADMLGTSVGIKEAVLGFSMNTTPAPIGVFGRVYTSGSMDFEALTLEDLGLESAFGLSELYFGATGAARFQDYNIPKAAFYLGYSCTNEVLERLDPEIAEFIGPISPLFGAYVRGSVEVPIYNNGCALTAAVGADIGAWYFTEPYPGTYGGLLGGSAYGELACLASLKGSVTAIGQKSGTEYKFAGSGWAAAGVGYCSPSKWKKISDARKDDWCLTGDASFDATFNSGDWKVTGPDVSCCH